MLTYICLCFVAGYGKNGHPKRAGTLTSTVTERELIYVILQARNLFLSEPALIRPPDGAINVVGDVHGQYCDLLRIFDAVGFPPEQRFLFLGDYVDRGSNSIECVTLLLCYKILYPDQVFMLRGNHETSLVNRVYGFYDECKRRYSVKIWRCYRDCFQCLPVAAVLSDRIFCVHGGLSPHLTSLGQIKNIRRPVEVPEEGLLSDLLWSDPEPGILGYARSTRGVSYTFGEDVVRRFLERNGLDLICRAHQVVEDGYEFFATRALVTVFSAPNYCGQFDNDAAVMRVTDDLICSFVIIKADLHLPSPISISPNDFLADNMSSSSLPLAGFVL